MLAEIAAMPAQRADALAMCRFAAGVAHTPPARRSHSAQSFRNDRLFAWAWRHERRHETGLRHSALGDECRRSQKAVDRVTESRLTGLSDSSPSGPVGARSARTDKARTTAFSTRQLEVSTPTRHSPRRNVRCFADIRSKARIAAGQVRHGRDGTLPGLGDEPLG